MKKYAYLLIILLQSSLLFSQKESNVVIIPTMEDFFSSCIEIQFKVYARQNTPITQDKIKARLIKYYKVINDSTFLPITEDIEMVETGKNKFRTSAIDTLGTIEFEVELESGIEKLTYKVTSMPIRIHIGNRSLLSNDNYLSLKILKSRPGIYATLDYNGLNGYGGIINYTILAIIDGKVSAEIINDGGKFSTESKKMISKLKANDILIIKNITYKVCSIKQPYKHDFVIKIK
jgi:hypothetical protein